MPEGATISTLTAALTAIGGGIAGAFTAWFLNYLQSSGHLTVTWRPREDGYPTIDVIARNAGRRSLKNVKVTSDDGEFKAIEFNELPAGAEYRIDTLAGRSDGHEYYTRHRWKWRRTKWRIDPPRFGGVKIGRKTATRAIADILENVEKRIADSPVVRTVGNVVSMSTPNKENWTLPSGVLAVLLPDSSETRRTHIQDTTGMGSAWRQMRPTGSSAGTHTPREAMRVVIDPDEISDGDKKRLREYLDDTEITLHLDRKRWPTAKYTIRTRGGWYKEAAILERDVEYMQSPGDDARPASDESKTDRAD